MPTEEYDLFISYADADREWVEGYLLDALRQAGVRYHSEAAFALGAPQIAEFEWAIKHSKRTLLVLSPAYLPNPEDDNNQFVTLLAQSYGREIGTWPVIPLILRPVKLPTNLSMLVPLRATNRDEWEEALERLCTELQHPVPASSPKPECPYPGMIPFSEANSDRFFGRDQEVQELLDRLRLHPFITVIGPSGSGKSSLVFAGLIPALKRSGLFGAGKWLIRTIRPGNAPLAALEAALGSDLANPASAVTTAIATQPNAQRLLLIVDQFEEVFTPAVEEAVPFQQALLRLVEIPNCYVILTVRADFYPELMGSPLWSKIQSYRQEVVRLDEVGLRAAIIKPTEKVGVYVEATLVERLVADAGRESGILPLVQEAMVLLWEKVERRFLPFRAYDDALVLNSRGYKDLDKWDSNRTGLQAAIANRADYALKDLNEKQQQIARRIFLRLIQFGEGRLHTRRQQSVEQLRPSSDDPRLFQEVLYHLANRRLLTLSSREVESSSTEAMMKEAMEYLAESQPLALIGGQKKSDSQTSPEIYVDIAHEALISGWPALDTWIFQRREAEQMRRRLVYRAEEWKRLKGKGGLLDEVELAEAGRWLSSPDAEELGYDDTLLELVEASDRAIKEAKEREEATRQRELQLIRERLEEEEKAKEQEQKAREVAQTRNKILIGAIVAVSTVAVGLLMTLNLAAQRQVATLATLSESRLSQNDQLGALVAAIKAGRGLKGWMPNSIRIQTVAALQQAVYEGQERNRLEEHLEKVNSVSFSPDNNILASASDDRTIVLWKRDGSKLKTIPGHNERVRAVAFSPDGKRLASASADQTVKLWDLDGNLLQTVNAHDDWVNHVSFSPDGQMFASASRDGTVKLWRLDGTLVKTFTDHNDWVNYVSFSPDGQILASASNDNTIKLWNVKDGSLLKSLEGHEDYVKSVRFNPDGRILASTSDDQTVRLWNVAKRELLTTLGHNRRVDDISFSPDGKMLASGSYDNKVWLWSIDGELLAILDGHGDNVASVKFSPDGKLLASGSYDNTVKLWSIETHHRIRHDSDLYSARLSPNGEIVAMGACDGKIHLWHSKKITSGVSEQTFAAHEACINSIRFSLNGQILASASDDKTIKLWNVAEGKLLRTLTGHEAEVTSVSFSRDGQILASGSGDKTIKLWHIANGTLIKTLTRHTGRVNSVSFSPNGKLLASGSDDYTIKIWSTDGTLLKTLGEHEREIAAVTFSPDSKVLASASWDTTVKLWDVNKRIELKRLNGHGGLVTDVSFSKDGKTLASSHTDWTVKLWSVNDGFLIKTLRGHQNHVESVQFSSDSNALLSSSLDETAILWNLELDHLLEEGCDRLRDYLKTNPNLKKSDRKICDNL